MKVIVTGRPKPVAATIRIPCISKIMALAIRFEQLIRDGMVTDQAELARLGHVTRARLSQIMMLLLLAPDIQEAILFLPESEADQKQPLERELRAIALGLSWSEQRKMWRDISSFSE